ncbi:replication initiator [Nonomuraea sp. NPDC049421]|uniref:replication initiator n=1 Tax=Nonomuraea sp. NPDC049421 TaxID=3155275 RepID=UPI0034160CCB
MTAKASAYADQPERVLRWGDQLDIRPITMGGDLTDQAVAGYIAKYAKTLADSRHIIERYVKPDIGTLRMQAVRASTITKLYRDLRAGGGAGREGQAPST